MGRLRGFSGKRKRLGSRGSPRHRQLQTTGIQLWVNTIINTRNKSVTIRPQLLPLGTCRALEGWGGEPNSLLERFLFLEALDRHTSVKDSSLVEKRMLFEFYGGEIQMPVRAP